MKRNHTSKKAIFPLSLLAQSIISFCASQAAQAQDPFENQLKDFAEASESSNATESNQPFETLVLESEDIIFKGEKVSKQESIAQSTLQLRVQAKKETPSVATCSATLIAKNIILTAAHCFKPGSEHQITRYENGKPMHISISKYVVHPRYQKRKGPAGGDQVTHDIALGKLAVPIEGSKIATVPAATVKIKPKTPVVAAGFGLNGRELTKEEALARPEVQAIQKELKNPNLTPTQRDSLLAQLLFILMDNPLLKAKLHATLVKHKHAITPVMMLEGPRNICSGDSGGPTYLVQNDKLVVIGVHSTGESTAGSECQANKRTGIMGLFNDDYLKAHDTYVPFYSSWIESEFKKLKNEQEI